MDKGVLHEARFVVARFHSTTNAEDFNEFDWAETYMEGILPYKKMKASEVKEELVLLLGDTEPDEELKKQTIAQLLVKVKTLYEY